MTMIRMLSQVLAESQAVPPPARAFFYDEERLRAHVRVHDRTLYTAQRDLYPARTVTAPDGRTLTWHLDRVAYPAEDLPSSELSRSIGHWNPAGQWEIFEPEQGEIVMLVALDVAGPIELVHCRQGEIVCARPGAWHLTYVLRGPAVVTNIYAEPKHEARVPAKYFSRPTVRAGLRRAAGDVTPFPDPPPPLRWERASDRRDVVGSLDGLGALFTSPAVHDLLVDPARRSTLVPSLRGDGAGAYS
jgi:hypothetical protein